MAVAYSGTVAEASQFVDSLSIEVRTSASVATNGSLQPLWSYSNQWGLFTQYKQAEVVAYAKAKYNICRFKYFSAETGLALVGKSEIKKSMIHEAYVAGKAFVLDYSIGMQAFSPLAKNDDVTSGSYLMSSNARPTPRIGVGFFDYWSIPYTRDWLQIKGAFYVGRLFNEYDADDEFAYNFTRDVVLHEKLAYGRLGGWYAKPFFGLVHSVMIGGKMPDGTEIPTDFWASFRGKGSEKFRDNPAFRGEATNAAGAHQGLWDMGIDFDIKNVSGSLYLQRMFRDNAGTKPFSQFNKDFIIGARVETDVKWLKAINIEWFKTSYQSGEGTPDPTGYDKYGVQMYVYPGDVPTNPDAFNKWVNDHFNQADITQWESKLNAKFTPENSTWFLRQMWHNGDWGGRKNYLDNGLYRQGWSQGGLSMGTPLFHSKQTVAKYIDSGHWTPGHSFFPNSRVNAVTLGVKGFISEKINYLFKYSVSKNHGSLSEKFNGAFGLKEIDNYFFTTSKMEHYAMLDLNYKLSDNMIINGRISADYGELYDSFALRMGIAYNINGNRR